MSAEQGIGRRRFSGALAAAGALSVLRPWVPGCARAAASGKLKVGVLLPRSGLQAQIGQSCQKAVELAPEVLRNVLGVELEVMNADTESNADTARTRAERLIQDGAHLLVGAFDSGHTAAVAQVAEQRGIPHVINIAGAPQITEQGYKFVFRNFPAAPELGRNALLLLSEIFRASQVQPRSAVLMHVNDTFGQSMVKGLEGMLPGLNLPMKLTATIPYDPAAKDLTVEISKAKAAQTDLLLLVCRLNDAIVLRREMVKQRWNPMAVIGLGSPGLYEEQFSKTLGKYAEHVIANTVWYNPKSEMTKLVAAALKKREPNTELAFHAVNVGYTFDALLIAADAFKRARSSDPQALADAIRQTNIPSQGRMSLGGAIVFNAKGQVEGNRSAVIQNLHGKPSVTLPADVAEAKLVFPSPDYHAVR
jgi:branched-chain amino acid transport system substrate-binding protein